MSFAFTERIRFLAEKDADITSPEDAPTEVHEFAGWAAPIDWVRRSATGPALRIKFLAKRLASEVYLDLPPVVVTP